LLDAQKLTAHNSQYSMFATPLRRENMRRRRPHDTGPQELGLRTLGRVASAEQFAKL